MSIGEESRSLGILAIDHGQRRIGVAVKPVGETMVLPAGVIVAATEKEALDKLEATLRDRAPDVIVVGLPVHTNMEQAARIKRFTRKLRRRYEGARWRFVDESLTSSAAEERLRDSGLSARGRAIDDHAAVLILESFLQSGNLASPTSE